ncbi:hypothetical protein ABB37_04504 [Leptomonas pyrrhocoris]|uniref:Uncharacterized protein n=1 Tax=Leptomonas pyrrhocoris TaxID=157538 RepID=A0A0M9G2Y3_LEPPY|nr:hypothetical protein ABB37_04504 [Leptomonas pyrrhocoris]KPA81163.1 hypothetical protein ABB37_04504 [Leptomonas pyrrhocoris]|eukprot:XP_015659602.1 hypothetical protein ABB37_04504 [Leptomonas pyrrhocoris]
MQGSSLNSQLGETHGVVVYHAASLAPVTLRAVFNKYGKSSIVHTYVLQDGNYATVVFFAESSSNVSCYVSLSLLAQESSTLGIVSVGWMHENGEEAFAKQPYIKSKYVEGAASPSTSPPATLIEGYLAVYWKGVAEVERADVARMAHRAASEVLEDEKEGGRSFLRFPSEDMADAFHSYVVSKYPSLRRCLSYADATDFALAKKSA